MLLPVTESLMLVTAVGSKQKDVCSQSSSPHPLVQHTQDESVVKFREACPALVSVQNKAATKPYWKIWSIVFCSLRPYHQNCEFKYVSNKIKSIPFTITWNEIMQRVLCVRMCFCGKAKHKIVIFQRLIKWLIKSRRRRPVVLVREVQHFLSRWTYSSFVSVCP